MTTRTPLGEKIREARRKLGLSQEDLAEALGTHRLTVLNWEAGRKEPTAANLLALAVVLEIDLSALAGS